MSKELLNLVICEEIIFSTDNAKIQIKYNRATLFVGFFSTIERPSVKNIFCHTPVYIHITPTTFRIKGSKEGGL